MSGRREQIYRTSFEATKCLGLYEINMMFLILLLNVYILSSSWVDSVKEFDALSELEAKRKLAARSDSINVIELDANSYIDYFQDELQKNDIEKLKELIPVSEWDQELLNYCNIIYEKTRTRSQVLTSEKLSPDSTIRVFSNDAFSLDHDVATKQLYNLRKGNSKETSQFWGFFCVNFHSNISWIVAPAFVPDSFTLFEFYLQHKHLSAKKIAKGTEFVVRSVDIAIEKKHYQDEKVVKKVAENTAEVLSKFTKKQ